MAQPVFHVINPAFSAATVQKIAYLVCMENTLVEEAVSHALKAVLFAQMLQLALNVLRDQFWLGQPAANAQSNAQIVTQTILLYALTVLMACASLMVHVFPVLKTVYLVITQMLVLNAKEDTDWDQMEFVFNNVHPNVYLAVKNNYNSVQNASQELYLKIKNVFLTVPAIPQILVLIAEWL